MIDPHTVIRTYLLTDAPLVALIGDRLYAGRNMPPKDYTPDDGPCIAFLVRGGRVDYEDALHLPSVQFKCYGGSEIESYEVYRALHDALHNGHCAGILWAQAEGLGQPLEEAETGWYFTLAYFGAFVRQS